MEQVVVNDVELEISAYTNLSKIIQKNELIDVLNPTIIEINQTNLNTIKGFMNEIVHNATQISSLVAVLLRKVLEQREIINTLFVKKEEATYAHVVKKQERTQKCYKKKRRSPRGNYLSKHRDRRNRFQRPS